MFEYEFNSRLCVLTVDNEYVRLLFERVFKKGANISSIYNNGTAV